MQEKMKIDYKGTLKFLEIAGILGSLSVLLGMCALVLTVIPCDLNLVKVLLCDEIILLLNIWPILCVMVIVYFLTNTIWVSFLSTGVLVFLIAEVNRFKMTFRDEPFVFGDILLISEAKNMAGKYSLYLDKVSVCALVFIVLATVLCFFAFKVKLGNKCVRISGTILFCLLIVFSSHIFYFKDSDIYNNTWHWEFGTQWKDMNQYMSRGVIYSFVRSIPDAVISSPEGYDQQEVKQVIGNYEDVALNEEKKVHIISIMLEAYNDFSEFEGIEFVEDPYENFHYIQNQSYSGKLYTDIFAAGTIRTERSFLTGYSDAEFYDRATESYVRYFKSQGYYTEAMHPCNGWFYDRKNINSYLGFDNFDYYENKYCNIDSGKLSEDLYHNLLADYDFFDYIIEGYERSVESGNKYFNFSVTYQNHGPYSSEKEIDTEYALRKEQYTEAEYNIFNNYLDGIAKTDRALAKLQNYIEQQDEPIVLILFGDHNPWLGDNNSVYEMLGIDLNLDTADGAQNYYQTPYVFYANKVAKKQLQKDFNEKGKDVSPMFLMNEFFEYVGIKGPAYLNYLQTIKEEFNVLNSVYVKKGNEYILRSELEDEEILIQQEKVEYYMKTKKVID